jgi:hypothetical protein
MTWLSVLLAMALIGVPAIAGAQGSSDQTAPGAMAAAMPGDAAGGMACPMMGQHPMHMAAMGAMRGMPGGEYRGHPGMGPMGTMGGMMGMMPMDGPGADPKAQARWMQMRGEMMKAMGDVLIRYGRELESGK